MGIDNLDNLLPEGEVIKRFTPATDIPVTHNGNVIGRANVDETGKIDMTLTGPAAKEIIEKISIGLAAAVIIDPTSIANVPPPRRSV